MGAYKASTLIDFQRGQPLELESMFLDPLRRAQKAGVATPRLAALAAVLALVTVSWISIRHARSERDSLAQLSLETEKRLEMERSGMAA